jgi:hypothetical protein
MCLLVPGDGPRPGPKVEAEKLPPKSLKTFLDKRCRQPRAVNGNALAFDTKYATLAQRCNGFAE